MKHVLTINYLALNGQIQSVIETNAATGAQAIEGDQPLAANGTPFNCAVAFDPTKVKSMLLKSDVDCSVAFHGAGNSVVGQVELSPNLPYIFMEGFGSATQLTDLLGNAVTHIVLQNTSNPLAAGTLQWRILTDPS